jgi:hypothetical protein
METRQVLVVDKLRQTIENWQRDPKVNNNKKLNHLPLFLKVVLELLFWHLHGQTSHIQIVPWIVGILTCFPVASGNTNPWQKMLLTDKLSWIFIFTIIEPPYNKYEVWKRLQPMSKNAPRIQEETWVRTYLVGLLDLVLEWYWGPGEECLQATIVNINS